MVVEEEEEEVDLDLMDRSRILVAILRDTIVMMSFSTLSLLYF